MCLLRTFAACIAGLSVMVGPSKADISSSRSILLIGAAKTLSSASEWAYDSIMLLPMTLNAKRGLQAQGPPVHRNLRHPPSTGPRPLTRRGQAQNHPGRCTRIRLCRTERHRLTARQPIVPRRGPGRCRASQGLLVARVQNNNNRQPYPRSSRMMYRNSSSSMSVVVGTSIPQRLVRVTYPL